MFHKYLNIKEFTRVNSLLYNRRNFDSPAGFRRSPYGSHMSLLIDNVQEQIKQRNTSFGIMCSPICKSYSAYLAAQGAVTQHLIVSSVTCLQYLQD